MSRRPTKGVSESGSVFGFDNGVQSELDPLSAFLLATLIEAPAIRRRNHMTFLTIRRWRQPLKAAQIQALIELKRNPFPRFVAAVADDLCNTLGRIWGPAPFQHVVPVPCSRSSRDACLSILIAEKLSARLRVPFAEPLRLTAADGRSHPRANLARGPMELLARVDGPIVLVDDVATTGRHLEEAVTLLRSLKVAVFAVAWIGGAADEV